MNFDSKQSNNTFNNAEDFFLIDVIGGSSICAIHPTRPIVAYNSGMQGNILTNLQDA